jgi:cytochrome c1
MNRQINYIVHASIILIFIGCGYVFFQKIFFSDPKTVDTTQVTIVPQKQDISLSNSAAKGKILFMTKCAACHNIFKDMTGPSILGFEERGPWADRKNVYDWIRNPAAFMKKNEYARGLKEKYGSMMTAFPDLTNEEIDAICDYLKYAGQNRYEVMPIAKTTIIY